MATVVGQYDGAEPARFYDAGLPDNSSNAGFPEDGEGTRFDTLYLDDTNTGEKILLRKGEPSPTGSLPTGFWETTLAGAQDFASDTPNGTSFSRNAAAILRMITTRSRRQSAGLLSCGDIDCDCVRPPRR